MDKNIQPLRSVNRRFRTAFLLFLAAFLSHSLSLIGVLPGALPSTGDTLGAFVPWHDFARRSLQQNGEIPLWNPHLFCGVPFLSNGQSGLLYPPTYLHFLLPENLALWLFSFGHSLFFMVGGYVLGRTLGLKRRAAFLTALLLGLGNASPAHLFGGHLTFLPTRSFWPWQAIFLLKMLRGSGIFSAIGWAVCLALGLAAGAPQLWLFGLFFNIALGAAWVFSKKWANPTGIPKDPAVRPKNPQFSLVLAFCLAALWCAPILLPLRELRAWSSHGDSLSFAQVTELSATPRSLFRLLFNSFFGGNSFEMWSLPFNPGEDAASIGLAPFLLASVTPFLSPKRRAVPWLFAGCLLVMALSLGSGTPLYRVLYDHSFVFQTTRVPARWLELWAFGAALLCGFGFDQLLREPVNARRLLPLWMGGALFCAALTAATLFFRAPWQWGTQIVATALAVPTSQQAALQQRLQLDSLVSCLTSLGVFAVLVWFWRRGLHKPGVVAALIALLAAQPLLEFWISTRIASPARVAAGRLNPNLRARYKNGERWIMRAPFGQLNAPLSAGIDALNGYEPFGSAPFFEFARAAQGDAPFAADFQPRQMSPLWRVAGASHLLWKPKFEGDSPRGFPGVTLERAGEWRLNSLQDGLKPWPRVYVTRQIERAEGKAAFAALQKLAAKPFEIAPPAVVETGFPALPVSKNRTAYPVETQIVRPDVRLYRVISPVESLLVENEAMAPGWKAFVDGKPTEIHLANALFRGVFVPAKTSGAKTSGAPTRSVALVYDSQTLRFSLFLSLCGLSVAAFALGRGLKNNADLQC